VRLSVGCLDSEVQAKIVPVSCLTVYFLLSVARIRGLEKGYCSRKADNWGRNVSSRRKKSRRGLVRSWMIILRSSMELRRWAHNNLSSFGGRGLLIIGVARNSVRVDVRLIGVERKEAFRIDVVTKAEQYFEGFNFQFSTFWGSFYLLSPAPYSYNINPPTYKTTMSNLVMTTLKGLEGILIHSFPNIFPPLSQRYLVRGRLLGILNMNFRFCGPHLMA